MASDKNDLAESKVLRTEDTLEAIFQILSEATWVRLAVAYWGRGASNQLKLAEFKGKDIIVVCDVVSGGCNPDEISGLIKDLGLDCIKTLDRLHSKLWLTDKAAIIGSSNASSNGLGQEGRDKNGLVEVNLLVTDPTTLGALKNWFDNYVNKYSRNISGDDLKKLRYEYDRHRRVEHIYSKAGETLLDLVLRSPEEVTDRDILLWVYAHGESSNSTSERVEKIKEDRRNNEIDFWELPAGVSAPKPGTFILDFQKESSKLDFAGAWQILQDKHIVEYNGGKLLLGVKVKKVHNLPVGKLADWKREIKSVLGQYPDRDEFELGEFADKLKAVKARNV